MADGAVHVRRWASAMVMLYACVAHALAAQPNESLDEHVQRLTAELRCLVCQNQTIADSQAELAIQLKQEVKKQLAAGASDQQVRDFMVQRYGEFVLYKPAVEPLTWLLWGGPLVLLGVGAGMLALHWRERQQAFIGVEDSVLPSDEVELSDSAWSREKETPHA